MSRTIYIMTLVLATFSCGQINEKKEEVKTAYSAHLKDNKEGNWYDKLIKNYIDKSENELIKLSRKDSTIKIEWLMDRVENTDTTKYLVFRVGHDVVEEENINKRFVTDGWIYIDSLTKQIYEYDLPNDSLIEWEQ